MSANMASKSIYANAQALKIPRNEVLRNVAKVENRKSAVEDINQDSELAKLVTDPTLESAEESMETNDIQELQTYLGEVQAYVKETLAIIKQIGFDFRSSGYSEVKNKLGGDLKIEGYKQLIEITESNGIKAKELVEFITKNPNQKKAIIGQISEFDFLKKLDIVFEEYLAELTQLKNGLDLKYQENIQKRGEARELHENEIGEDELFIYDGDTLISDLGSTLNGKRRGGGLGGRRLGLGGETEHSGLGGLIISVEALKIGFEVSRLQLQKKFDAENILDEETNHEIAVLADGLSGEMVDLLVTEIGDNSRELENTIRSFQDINPKIVNECFTQGKEALQNILKTNLDNPEKFSQIITVTNSLNPTFGSEFLSDKKAEVQEALIQELDNPEKFSQIITVTNSLNPTFGSEFLIDKKTEVQEALIQKFTVRDPNPAIIQQLEKINTTFTSEFFLNLDDEIQEEIIKKVIGLTDRFPKYVVEQIGKSLNSLFRLKKDLVVFEFVSHIRQYPNDMVRINECLSHIDENFVSEIFPSKKLEVGNAFIKFLKEPDRVSTYDAQSRFDAWVNSIDPNFLPTILLERKTDIQDVFIKTLGEPKGLSFLIEQLNSIDPNFLPIIHSERKTDIQDGFIQQFSNSHNSLYLSDHLNSVDPNFTFDLITQRKTDIEDAFLKNIDRFDSVANSFNQLNSIDPNFIPNILQKRKTEIQDVFLDKIRYSGDLSNLVDQINSLDANFLPVLLSDRKTETEDSFIQSLRNQDVSTNIIDLLYSIDSSFIINLSQERKTEIEDLFVELFSKGKGEIANKNYGFMVTESLKVGITFDSPKCNVYINIFSKKIPGLIAIRDELCKTLATMDDAETASEKIISIFELESVPDFVKRFFVFKYLYNPKKINGLKIDSPTLRNAKSESGNRVYGICFRDLAKININSGEESLMAFAKQIQEIENIDFDSIDKDEDETVQNDKLDNVVTQVFTLQLQALKGKRFEKSNREFQMSDFKKLKTSEKISFLKQIIGNHEKGLLSELEKTYLAPLGISKFSDIEKRYSSKLSVANNRNIENSNLGIVEGEYLIKAVNSQIFDSILNSGIISREFLGNSDADSDHTPLDTDFLKSDQESLSSDIAKIGGYGNLICVVKDRGQFIYTTREDENIGDKSNDRWQEKNEAFLSGVVDRQKHFGVRTGIDSLELDSLIFSSGDSDQFSNLKYHLARKDFYVPIYDTDRKLIFSQKDWDESKKMFAGTRFSSQSIEIKSRDTDLSPKASTELEKIKQDRSKQENQDSIKSFSDEILNRIHTVLKNHNIRIRNDSNLDIYGAEIIDTGSTGRGTNKTDGIDFDLAIVLDLQNFEENKEKLFLDLKDAFSEIGENGRIEQNGDTLRLFSAKIGEEAIDVDISIMPKLVSSGIVSSDMVVKEKFNNISTNYGEEVCENVKQQIVLAKTMMSEYKCYKKTYSGESEPSGIGGIGVENWILDNNGSFYEACKNLLDLVNSNGQPKNLEKFKEEYKLFDPGTNLRFLDGSFNKKHNNFISALNQKGLDNLIQMAKDVV